MSDPRLDPEAIRAAREKAEKRYWSPEWGRPSPVMYMGAVEVLALDIVKAIAEAPESLTYANDWNGTECMEMVQSWWRAARALVGDHDE